MNFERELKTLRIMRHMPSAVSVSSMVSKGCGGAGESGFCGNFCGFRTSCE
jgi:hypothetical protein